MNIEIDPQMHYCAQCKDEYMPETTTCGVCGMALVSGIEMQRLQQTSQQQAASRKGALTPDDDILTIFKAGLADVKRIERQLQQENIGTLIRAEKSSCGKGCCGGGDNELMIRREDAPAAMAIIEEDFNRQTASHDGQRNAVADYVIDAESSDNVCPACGTAFSPAAGQPLTCPDCGLCFG